MRIYFRNMKGWKVAFIGILGLQAFVLYVLGQPAICTCGYVKFWEGVVQSSGNSQHLFDWYTFSHIIHGFVFYFGLWKFFPKLTWRQRFVLAVGIEVAWEVLENTPMVIQHYREQALAQGYTGDSIINSLFDTFAMIGGFIMAWRLPVWLVIATLVGFELFVGYMIRDNLALNVINLIHVFPSIAAWQAG